MEADAASSKILIRAASVADRDACWAMLEPVIRAGETYTFPRDLAREDALDYWFDEGHRVHVAELDRRVLGTFILRASQPGGGAHVANAAFITRVGSGGRGVARAMLAAALERARSLGYRAMQFNFVVASNERAVKLWQAHGFEIVGRMPDAFEHPRLGFVDAYVMHRDL